MRPGTELPALTSLRGIAAWFVVLYHIRLSAPREVPPAVIDALAKGYLAVDLFFLLSGFVLWLSYAGRGRGGGARAAGDFLYRRLARIYPLHGFMMLVALGFAAVLVLTGRAASDYPMAELPLHLLLVQNWGFTDTLSWNVPAWSISCELAAYLVFPLLAASVDWERMPTGLLLAAVAALLLILHGTMAAAGARTLGEDITRFGLLRCLTEFVAGTALCAVWLRHRDTGARPACIAGAAALLLALGWAAGLPETLAVPAMLAALLLAVAWTPRSAHNPLEWRWPHYLGEISYATYLVHFLLFVAFKVVAVEDAGDVPLPLLGVFLLLTLAASALLHHLVEKPAQRALNALPRRRALKPEPQ